MVFIDHEGALGVWHKDFDYLTLENQQIINHVENLEH
jgi:hypothetical protein